MASCRGHPLLVRLISAAAIVLCTRGAWCAGNDAGAGRRVVYPTRILRRGKYKCLDDAVEGTRTLSFNLTSREVSIAYANWASARICGEISYILLSEVMGYKAYLFDTAHIFSSHPINYAAGCKDGDDISGRDCDIDDPLVHITVESWMGGFRRVYMLPESIRPVLLSTLEYPLLDQYFIWPDVRDSGIRANCRPLLDDYRTYSFRTVPGDNTSTCLCPNVSSFFTPWKTVYDTFKNMSYQDAHGKKKDLIVRCSEMTEADARDASTLARYTALTGDAEVSCMSDSISGYEDGVWFSKSCRENRDRCIPLVIQYSMDFAMQISYFLDMPLAVMMITSGKDGKYAEYYNVIQKISCIFAWYTPDDNLLRKGRLPVELSMPRTNKLEQQQGIYKTGLLEFSPRNYAWRFLPSVDRHVPYLASKIFLVNEDISAMMISSRQKKDSYQAHSVAAPAGKYAGASWAELGFDSPKISDELVAREVACEWVKQNRERWTSWIPSICPPGSESDDTLTKCLKCKAGFWCAGGTESSKECEAGHYCPSNSSAPLPCPEGFTSARRAQAFSDCNICVPSFLPVQSRCVQATVLVPSVVLSLIGAIGGLVFAYFYYIKVEANKKYRLSTEEIDFGENPRGLGFEIAGSMSAGRAAQSLWLATYKGAPVAAKVILTQQEEVTAEVLPQHLFLSRPPPEKKNWSLFLRDTESSRKLKVRSQFVKDFEKEMWMLCSLRHEHVANAIGFVVQSDKVIIVMEVMQYGSLYDLLHNETLEMDDRMVVDILLDVTLGMNFLHSQTPKPVVHKYLSSNNVLLGRNLCAKVVDFAYPRMGNHVLKNLRKALQQEDQPLAIESDASKSGGRRRRRSVPSIPPPLAPIHDGRGWRRLSLPSIRPPGLAPIHELNSADIASGSCSSGHTESLQAAAAAADESWATSAVVYMSPEILSCGECSCAGDVYAFGMLTYEVVAKKDPYSDQDCSLVEILKEIVKGELDVAQRLPIPPRVNPSILSLCRDCAHMQMEMRPHFGEVERRLRSLMTGLDDANATPNASVRSLTSLRSSASGRSFESSNTDHQSIEGNTYNKDRLFAYRRSFKLRQGNTLQANSFKDLASITSSTSDAASPLSIKQLLLEVFPSHVAKALMEGRKVEPESKECVTIFFSDVVGYTKLGGSMEPHLVMNMLDRLYTTFDVLSEMYDVFKVETIGDAYMAVANLHKDQSVDHVHRIACFALAAVDAAEKTPISLEHPDMGTVRIRVGFHCGPVVATVVGKKNPRYCLFGDTVNMASRMETNSVACKILCSLSAGNLLLAQAPASQVEKLEKEVKGKGRVECCWVNVVPDPFVVEYSLQESLQGFRGNSITQEDEKAAVVSLGCVLMSEGEKGEIVKEGGDVHIAISDFP